MTPISRFKVVIFLIFWASNIINGNGISVNVKKVHRSGLVQVLSSSPSSPFKQVSEEGTNAITKRVNEHSMLLLHLDALKEKIRFLGGGAEMKDKPIRKGNVKVKSTLKSVQNQQDEIRTLFELEAKLRGMGMNERGRALENPPRSGGSGRITNANYPKPDDFDIKVEGEDDEHSSLKIRLSKVLDNLMGIIINLLELEMEIMKNDKAKNYQFGGNERDDIIPNLPTSGEEGDSNNNEADRDKDSEIQEVVLLPVPRGSQERDKDKLAGSNFTSFPSETEIPSKQNANNNGSLEHLVNVLTQLVDQLAQQSKSPEVVNPLPPKQSPDQIGTIFIPVIGNAGGTDLGGKVSVEPGDNVGEHQTEMDDNDEGLDKKDDNYDGGEVTKPPHPHDYDVREGESHEGFYPPNEYVRTHKVEFPHKLKLTPLGHPDKPVDYPNDSHSPSPSLPVETTTSTTTTARTIETPKPKASTSIAQEPLGPSFVLNPLKPIMQSVTESEPLLPLPLLFPRPPPETEGVTHNNGDSNSNYSKHNYSCLDNETCSAYSSSRENCIKKGCSFSSKKTIPICAYIPPSNAVGITFYEAERISSYYHSLKLNVSSECQNIPTNTTTEVGIGWDKAISDLIVEKSNIRVTLYDKPNCQGKSYSPTRKLDDITLNFNDRTKSVRVCEESSSDSTPTCSVTFSRNNPISVRLFQNEEEPWLNRHFGHEVITMGLTEECTNVPSAIKTTSGIPWSESVSDVELFHSSNMSFILYDDFYCNGNAYIPSQGPQRSSKDVATKFNDKTKSIRLCGYSSNSNEGSTSASASCFLEKNVNSYSTTFYTSSQFRGLAKESAQVLSLQLGPTCTDMPPQVIGSSNAMRPWNNKFISNVAIQGLPGTSNNTIRVILYDQKGCQGISYSPEPHTNNLKNQSHKDFLSPDFDKVTQWQSAKICILAE